MTRTRIETLAALLLAALFLAGCGGGGGGDGVKQDLEAQVEMLMVERDAARQAQAAAEAARKAAEEAQAEAAEARAAAETARTAANEARDAAINERDTAKAAELVAKAAEAQAKADLADAKAAEMAAKAAQATAEAARTVAETARTVAETARTAAEAARAAAEGERDAAKVAQLEAEAAEAEALADLAEAQAAELAAKAVQMAAEAARDKALEDKKAVEADRDEKRDAETKAKIALIDAEAERDTAQAGVARLTGELKTANDNVAELTGNLNTANATVTELTNRIGTADDADSLTGKLAAANVEVTRLTGELTTAQGEVEDLTARVGTASDAESLTGMLDAANAKVTELTDDLDTANDDVTRLTGELNTANDRVTELETLIGDAVNPSSTSLRGQLAAARNEAAELRGELAGVRDEVTDAERRAQEAERKAERRVAELERQVDANARAQGLLTALEAVYDTDPAPEATALYSGDWRVSGNPASAGINTRQTDIELTALPLTGSTRKSGNFYTATLMRTAPGVNQPERKTVAYTDREKSRTFANHYASSIDATVGGTTSNPRFVNTEWIGNGNLLAQSIVSNPSRGGHPSTIGNGAENPANRMVSSLSARVRGVSGSYGCYNTDSSEACDIVVAAAYAPPATDARKELTDLTITPESGGTLYFDPGSGTISLLDVEKTGAPKLTDMQYITFGWWQKRPALVDGTYQAAVFATTADDEDEVQTFALAGGAGSAEYEGPAVGLYVDRTSEGGTTIYESGDFTATAILRATFGGGADAGVEGDVTSFRTTHGAKNWHVRLTGDGDDTGIEPDARIVQAGTSSTGTWEHSFLARHGNRAMADNQPIAVTGRFDVSIPNVRHIVGAFGAHRTTAPIGQ